MSTALDVRNSLVDALQLDLIGPSGPLGNPAEVLPQTPSRWYLTGFLVPTDADEDQRCDPTSNDELDQAAEPAGAFPFPNSLSKVCHEAGEQHFATRASMITSTGLGLTKTYNRFHDPHEQSSEIAHLRELHEAMDRAVLEAYGWDDLARTARCEFLLDYEEDGDGGSGLGVGEESQSRTPKPKSRRRKPYRLRWPDDFRDEVLARLLELNEQRHQEELLAGSSQLSAKKPATGKSVSNSKPKSKRRKKAAELQRGLEFGDG